MAEILDRLPNCQIPESRKAKISSDLKLQKGRTRSQAHPVFFAMLYEYSLPAEGPEKALLSNQSACFVLAMTISRTQTSCGIW